MKKRRWGLWISLFVVCFIAIYIYLSSFTLLLLPKGDFIAASTSPDNTYTLNAYLIDTGGARSICHSRRTVEQPKRNP